MNQKVEKIFQWLNIIQHKAPISGPNRKEKHLGNIYGNGAYRGHNRRDNVLKSRMERAINLR